MKIFKPIYFLLIISYISCGSTTKTSGGSKSNGSEKVKGRKLCATCFPPMAMHQNPYMNSMMSGGMGANPYMFNPMMGGMMNPMAGMAFNPFMMSMGPAGMPGMMNLNPRADLYYQQGNDPYQQNYMGFQEEQKLNNHLYKQYRNVLTEDLPNAEQISSPNQQGQPINIEQPAVAENQAVEEIQKQEAANRMRMLNGFNQFGQNNLGYKLNQFGNRFGSF